MGVTLTHTLILTLNPHPNPHPHPKDPFGGLVSDWVEEVSGVERIVISQDNKVNGKSCSVWGKPIKNYHDMDRATCFKEFNQKILDFIASRVD